MKGGKKRGFQDGGRASGRGRGGRAGRGRERAREDERRPRGDARKPRANAFGAARESAGERAERGPRRDGGGARERAGRRGKGGRGAHGARGARGHTGARGHAGGRGHASTRGRRRALPPARTSSAREERPAEGGVRLNKYLADHGVASRRGCDELIESGKVLVDGVPVTQLGTRIDPTTQTVEVGGVHLKPDRLARRYYLLYKPAGVVCTSEARETRPRAIDLITDPDKGRIFTVGRLDESSKGLILLTNDGDFAQRVAHPRFGVAKTYMVKLFGRISDEAIQKVREGVHLAEGRTSGARILVVKRTRAYSTLAVTLREGMNREVRRSFARVGFKVIDLVRTRIGPLGAHGLKAGRWRTLAREEVEALLEESSEERARALLDERRERRRPARTRRGEDDGGRNARKDDER